MSNHFNFHKVGLNEREDEQRLKRNYRDYSQYQYWILNAWLVTDQSKVGTDVLGMSSESILCTLKAADALGPFPSLYTTPN